MTKEKPRLPFQKAISQSNPPQASPVASRAKTIGSQMVNLEFQFVIQNTTLPVIHFPPDHFAQLQHDRI